MVAHTQMLGARLKNIDKLNTTIKNQNTMGILDTINKRNDSELKTTKGFYFGSTEAEGENVEGSSLLDYFEDYLGILNQLQIGKFIFTGRKGVGKSAIAKFIHDKSENADDSYAKLLRVNDIEIEKIIQFSDENETKEQLIFEWLILVNVVKLIISNYCGEHTNEFSKLRKFLEINSGIVNVDSYQLVQGEKNKGGEVNFAMLKPAFGGVFKNYFNSKIDKAPFYKLIPPLKDILKIILNYPVNKDLEFWLLFDDLDINFDVRSDVDTAKIMNLIRISKFYNNEIFKNNKAKILIFLREDIRNSIVSKYADSAKIFSTYEININWYNENNEDDIPLKKLANRRIKLNFERHNIPCGDDPWSNLFKSGKCELAYYSGKSAFKYVLDFTFYRPRDIITFLMMVTKENYHFPIDDENLKKILKRYIDVNIDEIKSELKLFFNDEEIEKLFYDLFSSIANSYSDISVTEFKQKIELLNLSLETELVFDLLSKYYLLSFKNDKGSVFFLYRLKAAVDKLDLERTYVSLPKCLYHYFRKIN